MSDDDGLGIINEQQSIFDVSFDVLDEYIDELNASDKENWHKWITIAMLYEFDTDDVIKAVWLYDKT